MSASDERGSMASLNVIGGIVFEKTMSTSRSNERRTAAKMVVTTLAAVRIAHWDNPTHWKRKWQYTHHSQPSLVMGFSSSV
jgi:hypothetical protein